VVGALPRRLMLASWGLLGPSEVIHLMTDDGLAACTGQLAAATSGSWNFINCPTCEGLRSGQLTLPLVAP
jgi:hypothetical protein